MSPRIRRAAAVVVSFEAGAAVGENFLWKTRAPITALGISLLARLDVWRQPAEVFSGPRAEIARELLAFIDARLIVVEGSAAGDLDERFVRDWKWGTAAAHYHFGIKDPDFQPPQLTFLWLSHKVSSEPQPALHEGNAGRRALRLGRPPLDGMLGVMARRRSWRGFDPARPLRLDELRDCLFSGFGILGFAESSVGEKGLPIAMTPSGGARNPFEAYVVALRVEGLAPGVYHYAGAEDTLGLVRAGLPARIDPLLGGQEWANRAGAVIFLVASFARSMWKYGHPAGFRVVLLEAGHIAQNLLLAATERGLASAPTAALKDGEVEELLGLDRVSQAALHAVVVGARSDQPSAADLPVIRPLA